MIAGESRTGAHIESDIAECRRGLEREHPDRVAERVRIAGNAAGHSWNRIRSDEKAAVAAAKELQKALRKRLASLETELFQKGRR